MTRARAAVAVLIALVVAAAIALRSCGDAPGPVPDSTRTGTGAAAEPVRAPTETSRPRARAAEVAAPVVTEAPRTGTAAPAAATTGVSISVVDEAGAPVDGAEVHLWLADMSAWTAPGADAVAPLLGARPRTSGGAPVVLGGLPPEVDGLRLRAFGSADGFPPLAPVEFALVAGRVVETQLVAARPRTVHVRVVDAATDAPVADARVVSTTEAERRESIGREPAAPAVTDAAGRCLVDGLSAGEHRFAVNAKGYEQSEPRWTDGDLVVRLQPQEGSCTVTAVVRGPGGVAVPNVRVWLVGTDRRLATDAAGRARFEDVAVGFVVLTLEMGDWDTAAAAGGWEDAQYRQMTELDVEEGGEHEALLGVVPLGSGAIAVRLLAADGRPLAGARVQVFDVGNAEAEAITDEGGAARLAQLGAGDYRGVVDVAGGTSWYLGSVRLRDGEQAAVTWTLGAATVKGRVVTGEPARPVPGVAVWFRGEASGVVRSGEDGRFELTHAHAGTYEIDAKTEAAGAPTLSVTVPTTDEVLVRLVAYGRVAARFAPPDREALRGKDVWVSAGTDPTVALLQPGSGDVDLGPEPLLPGRYELRIGSGEEERRFPFEVESGRTTVVELRAR